LNPWSGQVQSRGHARHATSDDQALLIELHAKLLDGFQERNLGNGHAHQVLCLLRRLFGFRLVNPGVLVPDVGQLEEITVEPRLSDGFLEKGFMGPGSARGHHHPVQPVLMDGIPDEFLRVLAAREQVVRHIGHIGEGFRIVAHTGYVDDTPDVDPAVADEDAHPNLLFIDGQFGRIGLLLGEGIPGRAEQRC